MKSNISILILLVLQTIGYSVPDANSNNTKSSILPWQVIAEEFGKGKLFCSKAKNNGKNVQVSTSQNTSIDSTIDYGFTKNQSIMTTSSKQIFSMKSQAVDVIFARWENKQWLQADHVSATIDTNGIRLDSQIKAEGFYALELRGIDAAGKAISNQVYCIICDDWKKDLLAFCRDQKEDCETHPDPQLIYSSIAVSHLDNLMELTSKSQVLNETILATLLNTISAMKVFAEGNCPDLIIGVNKIKLKRFEGASIAEFAVNIPINYDKSRLWPIYLHADPVRWGVGHYGEKGGWGHNQFHEGMIDVWWHTVTHKDIVWADFVCLKKVLKQKLSIDERRQYLFGLCGDGLAAMALLVNYPDQWAECMFSTGNSYRHLAGNAFNVKVFYGDAHPENENISAYMYFAAECLRYYGLRDIQYLWTVAETQRLGSYLPQTIINLSPYRVSYTIESLDNSKAYWTQIDGREDENFNASIDAIVWGQSVLIKTNNVDAYTLNLQRTPLDCNRLVEIIENGQNVGLVAGPAFSKKSAKYKDAVYVKNENLSGPVWDAFADPYVVVWGSGGKSAQSETNKKIAKLLAGSGPCLADTNVPENLISSHNLIVVGTAESNLWLAKVADKLPAQIKEGKILADGQSYEKADMGIILIYPNPLNPTKYVAVFTGTSEKAISNISTAYSQMKSKKPADIGIFEIAQNNQINWLRLEKFNTIWNWHSQWNQVLAETRKTHPQWQWRQWLAEVVRIQLGADAVVLEEPFESSEPSQGKITFRDVCSIFKNDWIVKISLSGKNLRELLMVPFKDISSRETTTPVIAGVALVKTQNQAQDKTICINELNDNKEYTVAFPYRAINGKRMGLVMKDYKITGEGYMVLLLKDYLAGKGAVDLDAELDGMKLNIM